MDRSHDHAGAPDATSPLSLRAAQVRRRLARGTYRLDLDLVAARLTDALWLGDRAR
jgi:hypothetical protein